MKYILFSSAMALSLMVGHAATAEQVKASEPESVLTYFKFLDSSAKIDEDSVGDPVVEATYRGTDVVVFFYGCSEGENCNSLQFYAEYDAEHDISLEAVNIWNAEERYGRAYLQDDGSARIEYDIYTGWSGVSREDFDEIFDIWTNVLASFEDTIS